MKRAPRPRWIGLILAALGLILVAAGAAIAGQSPLARWIIAEILTPVNVLPLIALGVALALIGARAMVAAVTLFILGIGCGLFEEDTLLRLLDRVPGAATHLFLTAPISYLAAGAAGRECALATVRGAAGCRQAMLSPRVR
jgi:hypothetical protein